MQARRTKAHLGVWSIWSLPEFRHTIGPKSNMIGRRRIGRRTRALSWPVPSTARSEASMPVPEGCRFGDGEAGSSRCVGDGERPRTAALTSLANGSAPQPLVRGTSSMRGDDGFPRLSWGSVTSGGLGTANHRGASCQSTCEGVQLAGQNKSHKMLGFGLSCSRNLFCEARRSHPVQPVFSIHTRGIDRGSQGARVSSSNLARQGSARHPRTHRLHRVPDPHDPSTFAVPRNLDNK